MSTQTETMNHKYPQPLANLPEQIVSAEKLIKHIEEERDVSIWDVAYEYMQEFHPNGLPKDFIGVGEQVVKKLKRHPSLWYNSPNYNCIGEYRVQGYEWMKFIWHIRYVCQVCQQEPVNAEESEKEEVEETTSTSESGYSKQQFQKLMSMMNRFITTTSVAEFMETSSDDLINLIDVTSDVISSLRSSNEEFNSVFGQLSEDDHKTLHETMSSMLWKMKPKIEQEKFKQFLNTTLINFVVSEQFTALKGEDMPLQAKMGKAKGLYFKWINQTSEYAPIFKMLTKNQKSKLTEKMNEAVKAEFESEIVEMSVQKAQLSPSSQEGKVNVEPVIERQTTPVPLEPKTPPIEELIGKRPLTPPPMMDEPPTKKLRFGELVHLDHLDLASSPASNHHENIEPKTPVEVKSFSFSESKQKMVTSSEVLDS